MKTNKQNAVKDLLLPIQLLLLLALLSSCFTEEPGSASIDNEKIIFNSISDQLNASENSAIQKIDLGLSNPSRKTITCVYDQELDNSVDSGTNCSSLSGFTLNTEEAYIEWTPNYYQNGNYEFKVTASNNSFTDNVLFEIKVANSVLPMVTTWRTTSSNESITLPLRSGFNYNFTVDWGDGTAVQTVTSEGSSNKTHTYSNAGDYEVTLTGTAEAWYFNASGDKDKLIKVNELGDMGWTDLSYAFSGCTNLTSFYGGVTNQVTNMRNMFNGLNSATTLDLSKLNTSNVTSMRGMFGNSSFSSLDLSSFDTSKVTTMRYMLGLMTEITSLDLTSFDTSNVVSMYGMFSGSTKLKTVDVSSFNTSKLEEMPYMFNNTAIESLDLSHFDVSQVTDMGVVFANSSNFKFLNATGWDISNVVHSHNYFDNVHADFVLKCDHGGSPGTGSLFGVNCN